MNNLHMLAASLAVRLHVPQPCEWPTCYHPHGRFVAPRHITRPDCTAAAWWTGCVAWLAGHCVCQGCVPELTPGPGTAQRCRCPDGTSTLLA